MHKSRAESISLQGQSMMQIAQLPASSGGSHAAHSSLSMLPPPRLFRCSKTKHSICCLVAGSRTTCRLIYDSRQTRSQCMSESGRMARIVQQHAPATIRLRRLQSVRLPVLSSSKRLLIILKVAALTAKEQSSFLRSACPIQQFSKKKAST